MKKEIITEIKSAMAGSLLPEQMKKLESILEKFITESDKEEISPDKKIIPTT